MLHVSTDQPNVSDETQLDVNSLLLSLPSQLVRGRRSHFVAQEVRVPTAARPTASHDVLVSNSAQVVQHASVLCSHDCAQWYLQPQAHTTLFQY